jgi:hypothetical protein
MSKFDAPVLLYHYTSAEGFLGILKSKEIWATKISYLNDSKELNHASDLCKEYLKIRKERDEISDELCEDLLDLLNRIGNTNVCVCSFTQNGDLLSQWRAYGGESNGYSIGFNSEQLKYIGEKAGFLLEKCIYDPLEQVNTIRKFVDKIIPEMSGYNRTKLSDDFQTEFLRIAALLKDKGFEEEEEWRLVSGEKNPTDSNFEFRASKSTLIPYFKIGMNFEKDKQGISEIIVGPTPNQQLALQSARILHYKQWNRPTKILNSKLPYRKL